MFPRPRCPERSRHAVGPNAVTRLAEALEARLGREAAHAVFAAAGSARLLAHPPVAPVEQDIVAALYAALFTALPGEAAAVAADAGARTARYLLRHRIPPPARVVLRVLPAPLAAPLLLRAIERNAWTFAGCAPCRVQPGRPHVVAIEGNPLAMPGCPWHLAVFEGLFRALISARATLRHVACCAAGAAACRFEICTPCAARVCDLAASATSCARSGGGGERWVPGHPAGTPVDVAGAAPARPGER